MDTAHSQTQRAQTQRLLRKINCATTGLLIVEDNDASRRLVMELLRAAGFSKLSFACDAEEAIRHLQAQAPDLMLLDWGLPGMSGIELVTKMRQAAVEPDPRFPDPRLPVVMMTARHSARDVTWARNAGINEFVAKPFSTASLLKAISSALTAKRGFIANPAFAGPDRRRRKAGLYPGLLRRADDGHDRQNAEAPNIEDDEPVRIVQSPLTAEIEALRDAMRGPNLDREQLNQIIVRLMHTQTMAHDLRMRLIERATQSLNNYVRLFGEKAEAEVLDVHMDALIRLNEAPHADPDEAMKIVKHLNTLVNKRKANRKVSQ